MNSLLDKIEDKTALVGIAGLGYVGLSLAVEFAKGGYQVLGVDISQDRIAKILRGESYILDVKSEDIALVNEIAQMCDRMGIDIWNVIEGAKTKPFGFMPFYPGPGIGGHCIPLDPMYLSWKAKTYDFYNRFIELATDINGNMPHFVVRKLSRILNQRKKPLNGSKILILGTAYKKDTDDIRESPGLEIYRLLKKEKCRVEYHDPYVRNFEEGEKTIRSKRISAQMLKKYDCVVVSTDHTDYHYLFIAKHALLIFDTRNAFKGIKSKKIVRL